MDPVSLCRSQRARPCFLGTRMEGLLLEAAVRGPAGTQALLSGVAGAGAQAVQKPLLAVSESQILR